MVRNVGVNLICHAVVVDVSVVGGSCARHRTTKIIRMITEDLKFCIELLHHHLGQPS